MNVPSPRLTSRPRSTAPARKALRWGPIAAAALLLASGCSTDDDSTSEPTSGAGGSAGAAGATCQGIVKSPTGKCSEEMFCKYGLQAFLKVNDSIIAKATAPGIETQIGDSFVKLAMNPDQAKVANFKTNLGVFLVNAYGGDPTVYKYDGSDMKLAHKGLGITQAQYDAFIANVVVPALSENGVPQDDISNCFAPPVTDPKFVADIVQP